MAQSIFILPGVYWSVVIAVVPPERQSPPVSGKRNWLLKIKVDGSGTSGLITSSLDIQTLEGKAPHRGEDDDWSCTSEPGKWATLFQVRPFTRLTLTYLSSRYRIWKQTNKTHSLGVDVLLKDCAFKINWNKLWVEPLDPFFWIYYATLPRATCLPHVCAHSQSFHWRAHVRLWSLFLKMFLFSLQEESV